MDNFDDFESTPDTFENLQNNFVHMYSQVGGGNTSTSSVSPSLNQMINHVNEQVVRWKDFATYHDVKDALARAENFRQQRQAAVNNLISATFQSMQQVGGVRGLRGTGIQVGGASAADAARLSQAASRSATKDALVAMGPYVNSMLKGSYTANMTPGFAIGDSYYPNVGSVANGIMNMVNLASEQKLRNDSGGAFDNAGQAKTWILNEFYKMFAANHTTKLDPRLMRDLDKLAEWLSKLNQNEFSVRRVGDGFVLVNNVLEAAASAATAAAAAAAAAVRTGSSLDAARATTAVAAGRALDSAVNARIPVVRTYPYY
jgi:hypothetical protein